MYQSRLFLSTLRESPADAEIASHQLMLKAGFIRQLASGVYSYMPLGLRVLRKIERIVREEMDRAGAQEMLMPVIQPAELWKESGRYDVYGPELIRFTDRHQREFALGPTHEEVITSIARHEINSYRKLPVILYQIQTKFRDERRPRFGLLRTREFLMKDAYSFDQDWEGLDVAYRAMYDAYHAIFTRLELDYRAVEADGGAIGGEGGTHEFMALAEIGEDTIAACSHCQYAANLEKAEAVTEQAGVDSKQVPPSPAIERIYTPDVCTIAQLQQFLHIEAKQIIKTMLFMVDGRPVAVAIRGDYELNELKIKNYLTALNIELADGSAIAANASAAGYIGPIDLTIPLLVDYSVLTVTDGVAGANEQNHHFKHIHAIRDLDLTHVADFRNVIEDDLCPRCQTGKLTFHRGIELGHIFKLGTKYSESLSAAFLDQSGKAKSIIMGCYGIGISRILAAIVEQRHSEQGVVWPKEITPYQVHIIVISYDDQLQKQLVEGLHQRLLQLDIEVLIDDRAERAGVKFKDADLIGIPYRLIVGKDAADGKVEWFDRTTNSKEVLAAEAVLEQLKRIYCP